MVSQTIYLLILLSLRLEIKAENTFYLYFSPRQLMAKHEDVLTFQNLSFNKGINFYPAILLA